ncbi:hypothetical protein [Chachezhania sediminis]|uniref:hypothetical protein n=1 Tax=Chachezhania sediminis TaxID=2599291 RepID=UPI00131BA59C|nr:hypothetical protein [Chachezhania sediminis]
MIEFGYRLTKAEVKTGGQAVSRSIYSGGARIGWIAQQASVSVGIGVLPFLAGYFIITAAGATPEANAREWLLLSLVIGGILVVLIQRNERRRLAVTTKVVDDGAWRMAIDSQGLSMTNGRSKAFNAWADCDDLVEAKRMIVLRVGAVGYAIPDRLLAQVGDVADLRRQIVSWYAASRT